MVCKDRNNENSVVTFQDYWKPYNRMSVKVKAMFEKRQVILNGVRCARRETYTGRSCAMYDNIVLINW
ncbi:hypothetical protein NARC_100117 [Candidatus Nitrosocosmicus arcticus]|uniref:Uncharacterized protein n=1 Tax=Candidatus Nitrosocosmicus arcticus TaxID=2035267 RepID=A0A557STY7_9ARCH|nr:hypothetical protein NARC_100117 [Candidatus Nitrosocosmicus arcticus]